MIAPERTACILLAAGRSERFGPHDKLLAPLHGEPVGCHAGRTFSRVPFSAHIAVVADPAGPLAMALHDLGFSIATGEASRKGMGHSIALGMYALSLRDYQAVMIALADMPFVTEAHVKDLLARWTGEESILASGHPAGHALPPALFGQAHFPRLAAASGDQGARDLLQGALRVEANADELADIDRPGDLPGAD